MDPSALHEDAVVIDGLIISKWSRSVFEDMRAGGLSAANCTCSVWEGFQATMENIAQWKRWFRDHDDLLAPVDCSADILRAKEQKRTGIILGWQNTSALEDRAEFVELFRDLGVRVMQLTYNTQNLVGSGCWETRDGGLSDFGRDVIDEMNRCGVLVGPLARGTADKRGRRAPLRQAGCLHPLLPLGDPGSPAQQDRRRSAGGGGSGRP